MLIYLEHAFFASFSPIFAFPAPCTSVPRQNFAARFSGGGSFMALAVPAGHLNGMAVQFFNRHGKAEGS